MRTFIDGNGGGPAFLQSCRGGPGQVQCWIGELFTYTLANGTVYRWTSFDLSLTVGSDTWLSARDGAPVITRNRFSVKNTVEIPELELRLGCSDTLLSNLKRQIHNGLFDGARAEMDRVFMPSPGDTQYGYVVKFNGRQSSAVIDAEGITLTAKGDNVLMNQQAPRNLYQTTCLHTFCDAGCGLNPASFTVAGTVIAAPSASAIQWSPPSGLNNSLFALGTITMTSGAAEGQTRTIASAEAGTSSVWINLIYPLYEQPVPGDTFNALMGCARSQNACQNHTDTSGGTVNNQSNFRGYPYTPPAYVAV
ncbi:MAG TPA: DUF2163 domain-containing protein [Rhizomicrobium sp.]|nr:DUF2163 domain-containing protein [Rhizomicrobium sp.]